MLLTKKYEFIVLFRLISFSQNNHIISLFLKGNAIDDASSFNETLQAMRAIETFAPNSEQQVFLQLLFLLK